MSTTKIPLAMVKVASPCTASWDGMAGDDKARFCGHCSLHVYNLSALTQDEAESLITEKEGHLCVRFYRRFDGTVMTSDCPVGWAAIKRRVALFGGVAAAVFVAMFSLLTLGVFASEVGGNGRVRVQNPITLIKELLFPRQEVMGDICPPIAPPPANVQQPGAPVQQ